jgi:site-specific recombinase XerD
MGKISTKELFDRYFESDDAKNSYIGKTRTNFEKPEFFEYEMKIGKEFVDMNTDELIGLIEVLTTKKKSVDKIKLSNECRSYHQAIVFLRKLYDFYIRNYELKLNPFNEKEMKAEKVVERLTAGRKVLTYDYLLELIEEFKTHYKKDRGEYIELIILLYYSGFRSAEEIASMKKSQVNHKDGTVILMGRTIHLTERCNYLLKKFADIEVIEGWRTCHLISYRGSYFKFISKTKGNMDDKKPSYFYDRTNIQITLYASKYLDVNLDYRSIFWLGFYDRFVERYGEEESNAMITSLRDNDANDKIILFARDYGIMDAVSQIKKELKVFIKK